MYRVYRLYDSSSYIVASLVQSTSYLTTHFLHVLFVYSALSLSMRCSHIPLFCLFFFSVGNFLVTPLPMTVTNGSVTQFNCSANTESWFFRVNGTSVNQLNNPDIEVIISIGMETRLHMLQIVANEDYNNTRVQCVTFNSMGDRVFSSEVMLTIQGKRNICMIVLLL